MMLLTALQIQYAPFQAVVQFQNATVVVAIITHIPLQRVFQDFHKVQCVLLIKCVCLTVVTLLLMYATKITKFNILL